MAVAIWPDKPTADELLQWRISHQWQPTASLLQDGAEILGHAACLVIPRKQKK